VPLAPPLQSAFATRQTGMPCGPLARRFREPTISRTPRACACPPWYITQRSYRQSISPPSQSTCSTSLSPLGNNHLVRGNSLGRFFQVLRISFFATKHFKLWFSLFKESLPFFFVPPSGVFLFLLPCITPSPSNPFVNPPFFQVESFETLHFSFFSLYQYLPRIDLGQNVQVEFFSRLPFETPSILHLGKPSVVFPDFFLPPVFDPGSPPAPVPPPLPPPSCSFFPPRSATPKSVFLPRPLFSQTFPNKTPPPPFAVGFASIP